MLDCCELGSGVDEDLTVRFGALADRTGMMTVRREHWLQVRIRGQSVETGQFIGDPWDPFQAPPSIGSTYRRLASERRIPGCANPSPQLRTLRTEQRLALNGGRVVRREGMEGHAIHGK